MICFILLTANIIRIFYWFGEPFETTLLVQSFVMIIVQLALLHALTKSRMLKQRGEKSPEKHLLDGKLEHFWEWDAFSSYAGYAALLASTLSVACTLFLPNPVFVSFLGYSGLLIEATLALPQLVKNHKGGTEGLSAFLFWTWLIGDVAKTVFFVQLAAPLPFVMCGAFQTLTDAAILTQIYLNELRKPTQKAKQSHQPGVEQ
jgi:hypothetical protein